jgi:hypothetical protein
MWADQDFPLPGWWWGTNPPGGTFYAGRVHLVHPDLPGTALCGLPVEDVSRSRPLSPEHLCPDCCVLAVDTMYPPAQPRPGGWQPGVGHPAEQTVVLPAVADGDP